MSKKKAPRTITRLRDDLLQLFAEVGNGDVKLELAKEKNAIAGKVIKSVAIQIEYARLRKAKPNIPFMK